MVDGVIDRPGRGKRAKATAILGARAAMFDDARIVVILGDQDVWEAFVIAQQDVVARFELLDQVGFKKERLGLGMSGDDFHPHRLGHHAGNADRQLHDAGIGHHAFLEVFGLADIKNAVLVIDHAIDTSRARHGFQRIFDRLHPACCPAVDFITIKRQTDFPPRGVIPGRVFGGNRWLHQGTPQSPGSVAVQASCNRP